MALVEELLNVPGNRELTISGPGRLSISPARLEELAINSANSMVEGYLAQDRGEFDASVLHFSLVFHSLFPENDSEQIHAATKAFVTALFSQSKLKEGTFSSKEQVPHDERWEHARNEMMKFCQILAIPTSFAHETIEFYKYYAIRDDFYIKHLLESQRVLLKRVVGSDALYRETAGIALSTVGCHDRRDRYGVTLWRELLQLYFATILHAKYGFLG